MTIDLNPRETEILQRLLEERHRHLQVETRRADSLSYKEGLNEELDAVDALRARLGSALTSGL